MRESRAQEASVAREREELKADRHNRIERQAECDRDLDTGLGIE